MTKATYDIVLPALGAHSNRGAMGWCNICLIRSGEHTILFDTGSNDDRPELVAELERMNVAIDDIDTVFVSHSHYDHIGNIELFEKADIYLSARELDYVLSGEFHTYGDHYIPYGMIRYYEDRIRTFSDGQEILPGLRALYLPGHTPGVSGLVMEKERIILTGDAVKNAYDYTNGIPPYAIFDAEKGLESYKKIPPVADTIVPGHGRAFTVRDGAISYVGEQKVIDMMMFPNMEHLDEYEERLGHRIIL